MAAFLRSLASGTTGDGTCPRELVKLSRDESGSFDLIEFDSICKTLLGKPSNLCNHELQQLVSTRCTPADLVELSWREFHLPSNRARAMIGNEAVDHSTPLSAHSTTYRFQPQIFERCKTYLFNI
jgi:hypothetical protein